LLINKKTRSLQSNTIQGVRHKTRILSGHSNGLLTASSAQAAETISYKYDALGRLITKSIAGSVNTGKKITVCYDAAGNRKVYKVAANGTAAVCP
jgi:YD repeat-containing protein